MRDARSPIDGILSPFGVLMGSVAFSPLALFAMSELGVWYDPLDLTTLFQDAAGTTPVTAAAQPDGLTLDKSRGLVLQPESLANGTFSSGTTGWTGTVSASSGNMTVTTTGGFQGASCTFSAVSGQTYRLSFSVVSNTATWNLGIGNGTGSGNDYSGPQHTTPQTVSLYFKSTVTGIRTLWFYLYGAGAITVDYVSVRELPGIHASQASATFKPAYQTTPQRLQFDGSDDRLPFTYNPTTSGSLAVRINGTTASRVVMGSQAATDGRAFIALAADGSLGAGIGAQSTSTIKGATDIRGVWATGVVTWDGTTVRLYQNGVEVYSGAQSGAVNTTVPLRVGCLNSNGTDGAFWAGGIGAAIALGRVMTPAEISSLHTLWSTIQ